jgi:hypothetical protein
VADGVRQLITNQEETFNAAFFSTVQLVLAGNDSQGLRYGTTGTPEQFFVDWKDEARPAGDRRRPPVRCWTGRWPALQPGGCWTWCATSSSSTRAEEGAAPAPV